MRTSFVLFFLLGCAMPPPAPAADGGIVGDGSLGDSSVPVDSGNDADPPHAQDTGIDGDAGVADGGSELDAAPAPVHLDRYEVNAGDLASFRLAGAPEATVDYPGIGLVASGPTTREHPTGPCLSGASDPANCLTWSEAFALCAWLGRRMPTRDEWLAEAGAPNPEEITSGTTPRAPIRGDHVCPSAAAVCDAHGNVAEWVIDGGNVAMGEAYDSALLERTQGYASPDVGVRCWGAAR